MVERSTTKTIKAIENVDIDVKEVDDLTFRIKDNAFDDLETIKTNPVTSDFYHSYDTNGSNAYQGGTNSKPYTNSRPSYGKNQVNEVWENAKDPVTGKVYDPSGVEITWDKTKPRNGQWDMGHIPGEKYSEMHQLYMDDVISKEEFLEWYRNPNNYRPELPSTNRSHKFE